MRTALVKGIGAKESNTNPMVWRGQAIIFGWLGITKTFTNKEDAVLWYDRYQQGWRYRKAVAVVWQGCRANTPERFFCKDALLGGAEWRLAREHAIRSTSECAQLLNSSLYEGVLLWER